MKFNYDIQLYKQILQNKKNLKTYKRASYILPEDMIGTQFGQYIFTRKICKHKIKKVIKK